MLIEKIEMLSNATVIKKFEKEIEDIENKLLATTEDRNQNEIKMSELQTLINRAKYFMEHLEDLFIQKDNPDLQAHLFGLLFEETPTYEELQNGTPKLKKYYCLNAKSKNA